MPLCVGILYFIYVSGVEINIIIIIIIIIPLLLSGTTITGAKPSVLLTILVKRLHGTAPPLAASRSLKLNFRSAQNMCTCKCDEGSENARGHSSPSFVLSAKRVLCSGRQWNPQRTLKAAALCLLFGYLPLRATLPKDDLPWMSLGCHTSSEGPRYALPALSF